MSNNGHTAWRIQGEHAGSCNCIWSCPCQFNALPDKGQCETVVAWEIRESDADSGSRSEWYPGDSPPEAIAAAIAEEVGREVDYLPVEQDGASRAAARIAELL